MAIDVRRCGRLSTPPTTLNGRAADIDSARGKLGAESRAGIVSIALERGLATVGRLPGPDRATGRR